MLGYSAETMSEELKQELEGLSEPQSESRPETGDRLQSEFAELCQPLCEWLNRNFHPYTTVVICGNFAELSKGVMGYRHKTDGG